MQLEGLSMARSIDNCFIHYSNYSYLKYAYEKWYIYPKIPKKFNRILRKMYCKIFAWILFEWMQNPKLYKNYLIRRVDLLCGSWVFKQSCFLIIFDQFFQNQFWNPVIIDLSCDMSLLFWLSQRKVLIFRRIKKYWVTFSWLYLLNIKN